MLGKVRLTFINRRRIMRMQELSAADVTVDVGLTRYEISMCTIALLEAMAYRLERGHYSEYATLRTIKQVLECSNRRGGEE